MSVPRRRAWVYIRESKEAGLLGYSPDVMAAKCRQKAELLGADVTNVITEAGKRDEYGCPGLLKTIRAAGRGEYDYLISYDMVRLTGELPKHIWLKEQLARTKVTIHYVVQEFPAGPHGEFMETIQGAQGTLERAVTRLRTQNGIVGKLENEEPICGGPTPYGLAKVYGKRGKPIGFEAAPELEVLKWIVRSLQTMTVAKVCAALNERGVPTPGGKGKPWVPGIIQALLDNTTYTGLYQFGKTKRTPSRRADGSRVYLSEKRDPSEVTTFAVPVFLDPLEVEAARAAMRARKRNRTPRRDAASDPYILRGMLTCGHCSGALSTSIHTGHRYYTCLRRYGRGGALPPGMERCPLPDVRAESVELEAWARLIEAFTEDGVLEQIRAAQDGGDAAARHQSQVASLTAQIARYDLTITNAVALSLGVEAGSTSQQAYTAARIDAERHKATAETSLRTLLESAPAVLTEADAVSLKELRAEVEAGLTQVGRDMWAGRRGYLLKCGAQGVIRVDPGGVKLGTRHRFSLAWSGQIAFGDSGSDSEASLLLWTSGCAGVGLELRPALRGRDLSPAA
jgi:DNA invertase Pin-like site-specific DNA recombinase